MLPECFERFRSYQIPSRLVLFLAILPLHPVYSQFLDTIPCLVKWGSAVQISNTPSSALVPKLAIVGDTVHALYRAQGLYYRRSTDGGLTWDVQALIVTSDSLPGQVFNRPFAASGMNLYVVWGNSSPSGAITSVKIRRSNDGGGSWLEPQVLVPNTGLPYYDAPKVAVYGEGVYVVMKYSGEPHVFFMHSEDHGGTWDSIRQITFGTPGHGSSHIAASATGVHVVGVRNDQPSGSEIGWLVSTNMGMTWSPSQVLSTVDTYQAREPNVAADDSGNVYVCWLDSKYGSIGGFAGTVLLRRSTDNGQTWLPEVRVTPVPAANGSSIAFSKTNVHVGFGDERDGFQDATARYRSSADGGETWCDELVLGGPLRRALSPSVESTPGRVYAIWSSDRSTPGDTAHVFISRGDVITDVREDDKTVPNRFSVLPPYPNPFNPSISIEYNVPYESQLSITVFDMLGRNVASVANGNQPSGRYRLSFDGSNLANGIYYFRFQFDTQTITKEVVLLK